MSQEGWREDLDLGSGFVSELWGRQSVWGSALLNQGVGERSAVQMLSSGGGKEQPQRLSL